MTNDFESKHPRARDGKYHRERGPAVLEYTEDGQGKAEKYFIDGEEVPGTRSLFGYAE